MANTYTKIYIHIIFTVSRRENLIITKHKEELHKYIFGIIKNKGQKLLAINCMPDHVHILLGLKPDISLSDLVRDIKNNSSKFINQNNWFSGKFNWQEGFGAFSYSHSQIYIVKRYIENQCLQQKKNFINEYVDILNKYDVQYDQKYIFKEIV